MRIYAEAMMPSERVFRTSDTNSVRICQELCAAEGLRCQSFSFGVSARGNGTCQLSGERVSENAGRRPRGTLYDPDFNLYQRKANCGIDDGLTRPTGEFETETISFTEQLIFMNFIFRWNIPNSAADDILEWWTSFDDDHIHKHNAGYEFIFRSISSAYATAQWWSNNTRWHNIDTTVPANAIEWARQHIVNRWWLYADDDKRPRPNALDICLWQHKHRHLHKRSAATASDDDLHVDADVRGRCQTGRRLSISSAVSRRQIQLLPGHLSDILVSHAVRRQSAATRNEFVPSKWIRFKCAVDWHTTIDSQLLWRRQSDDDHNNDDDEWRPTIDDAARNRHDRHHTVHGQRLEQCRRNQSTQTERRQNTSIIVWRWNGYN